MISAAAILAVAIATAGADWTQFRGPGGGGTSREAAIPDSWSATENLLWKTPLPGPGASSPIVLGNRIFLTCHSGFNVPGKEVDDPKGAP